MRDKKKLLQSSRLAPSRVYTRRSSSTSNNSTMTCGLFGQKKNVIITYSKSKPIHVVNKEHFLTPDTPQVLTTPDQEIDSSNEPVNVQPDKKNGRHSLRKPVLLQQGGSYNSTLTPSRIKTRDLENKNVLSAAKPGLALRNISNIPIDKTLSRMQCTPGTSTSIVSAMRSEANSCFLHNQVPTPKKRPKRIEKHADKAILRQPTSATVKAYKDNIEPKVTPSTQEVTSYNVKSMSTCTVRDASGGSISSKQGLTLTVTSMSLTPTESQRLLSGERIEGTESIAEEPSKNLTVCEKKGDPRRKHEDPNEPGCDKNPGIKNDNKACKDAAVSDINAGDFPEDTVLERDAPCDAPISIPQNGEPFTKKGEHLKPEISKAPQNSTFNDGAELNLEAVFPNDVSIIKDKSSTTTDQEDEQEINSIETGNNKPQMQAPSEHRDCNGHPKASTPIDGGKGERPAIALSSVHTTYQDDGTHNIKTSTPVDSGKVVPVENEFQVDISPITVESPIEQRKNDRGTVSAKKGVKEPKKTKLNSSACKLDEGGLPKKTNSKSSFVRTSKCIEDNSASEDEHMPDDVTPDIPIPLKSQRCSSSKRRLEYSAVAPKLEECFLPTMPAGKRRLCKVWIRRNVETRTDEHVPPDVLAEL